ncbi:MAG: hypothetical protein EPO12_17535 [Aquabacterium sp.]|jgi:hypothetical protein|nr:MAG: hypothetical protein EPO12_17535 [Aquabacterium sp.]
MTTRRPLLTLLRREALTQTLLSTVDLLRRRQAAEVPEKDIDDYVSLDWLEWHGGSLRLTVTGGNICKQLSAGLA